VRYAKIELQVTGLNAEVAGESGKLIDPTLYKTNREILVPFFDPPDPRPIPVESIKHPMRD